MSRAARAESTLTKIAKKTLFLPIFFAKIMLKFGAKSSHSVSCEPKYKKYLKNRSKVASIMHRAKLLGVYFKREFQLFLLFEVVF